MQYNSIQPWQGTMWKEVVYVLVILVSFAVRQSTGISTFDLAGTWKIVNGNGSIAVSGHVPGSVHTSLINASILSDPYYRFNDDLYRWVAMDNWTYSLDFIVKDDFANKSNVKLVCNGLDTVANVTLNGIPIGQSSNMFVRKVWDVKKALKVGHNTIQVAFESAVTYAASRFSRYPYDVPRDCPPSVLQGICHRNFIRKEQCSFAWDWGPAFAPVGIWKDIYLEAFDEPVIRDVVAVPYRGGKPMSWWLNITVHFDLGDIDEGQTVASALYVQIPNLLVNKTFPVSINEDVTQISLQVQAPQAETWWPHGYGSQPLYPMTVSLKTTKSSEVSQRNLRVGFRTVQLVQEKIANSTGLSFYFRINNKAIFIKGSNWIPADAFQERITPERLSRLLQSAVDANMHALRVWGGGIYEQDRFYELCDEMGIILWQDFMFACAMYPTDEDFLQSVREEVTYQVRRLNNHPSVIAWSANNENEGALRQNWYGTNKNFTLYASDYVTLYISVIWEIVVSKATGLPFMSSSPSNGIQTQEQGWIAKNPQSTYYGDVHYYNYNADCWNVSSYPKPRFASEYGVQSWPSFETLSHVSIATDWSYDSAFSAHRQHHALGQSQMLAAIQRHFNLPSSKDQLKYYKDLLYLTQISQALCIKFETEHYRRLRSLLMDGQGHCMGALYWQLNDIWQAPTWSSIEYGDKWKMLHYYAKDFFAPAMLSGVVQDGDLLIYGISDTHTFSNATYLLSVRSWSSFTPVFSSVGAFSQPAGSSKLILLTSLASLLGLGRCGEDSQVPPERACFITLEISDPEVAAPVNFVFPASFSDVGLKKANIVITAVTAMGSNQFNITLKTDSVAPFTWLESSKIRGRFSTNGFLFYKASVAVVFFAWQPTSSSELAGSLKVSSLMDIYS
ncbi:beta-mannosidase-like [Diadema antillarum]|uniref:beta-mannosidase-like n=1 Tax=Diadema antillarum TaxID=105358 RepID=UPI003A8B0F0C